MRAWMLGAGLAVGVVAASMVGAVAEPISGSDARKLLFGAGAAALSINPNADLDETELAALQAMVAANPFNYYGAMAFGPDAGLISETLQGAFNFHDPESAQRAALAACEAVNAAGASPCVIAAQILPRRWEARDFQLSQDATQQMADYRRIRDEKALAISASSGSFGFGQGGTAEADALIECNRNAPARDCVIAVRN